MFSQWIRREKRNRSIVVIAVVGIAWAIAAGVFGSMLWHSVVGADELSGATAVDALSHPEQNTDYIDISGDATLDTGVRWVSRDQNGNELSTDYHVVAMTIDDRIVLVKVGEPTDATRFRGTTQPLDESLLAKVTEGVPQEVRDRILPVALDATDDWRLIGNLSLGALLICTIAAGILIPRWIRQGRNPSTIKSLRSAPDPVALLADIDADLARPGTITSSTAAAGSKYLATRDGKVAALDDVVWIHSLTTKKKAYGFITVRTDTSTIIRLASGEQITVPTKKNHPFIPERLIAKVPWAYGGFDKSMLTAWNNPAGRAQMIAAAAARRDQMRQAHAAATPATPAAQPAHAGAVATPVGAYGISLPGEAGPPQW